MAIPLLRPTSSEHLEQEMIKVLRSGWWGYGPVTKTLEKRFAKLVGKKYAVAVSSGTAALDLCLKAHNIRGGTLITPAFTFVSNAIVGEWNDMEVLFADIDEETFCIDPHSIKGEDIRAIMAVNSHGRLADTETIKNLFPHALLIEDCAHACLTPGVGKHSDIQIFSFQAVKTIPAGDGGMITTNDEEVYNRLKSLTWLGVEKTVDRVTSGKYSWDYQITHGDGIKAYMNDLTAVIAMAMLDDMDSIIERRQEIQHMYNMYFADIPQIETPRFSHTVQYFTMKCEDRDGLSEYLAENEVHTSVHFKPLSHMTYWKKAEKYPLPVTDRVWPKLLSLPVHGSLSDEDVQHIVNLVRDFYA